MRGLKDQVRREARVWAVALATCVVFLLVVVPIISAAG